MKNHIKHHSISLMVFIALSAVAFMVFVYSSIYNTAPMTIIASLSSE
jgi:heme/copper-type cytochrome/quinol oxidase subunit 4